MDDLVARLRLLKAWSHDMSYAAITRSVNDRWKRAGKPGSELTTRSTVAGYFAFGRSRLDEELLVAIVSALHAEPEYVERWRRALRAIRGDATAATMVDAACKLPCAPRGFVGRRTELRMLEDLAGAGGSVVIHGMPGVGKTWLAIHAAHRLVDAEPRDRIQLVADLRGFDPEAPPACPSAILAGFLRHLGLRYDEIPRALADRVETYRALVRDMPTLVILDDAADPDRVTPLIPDGQDCFVLVTSRVTLTGLRNATHLRLAALDSSASVDLLREVAGAVRVDADLAGARRIAERVGHHPLALSIIGEHLRDHPDWPIIDCARPVSLALAGGVRSTLATTMRDLPATTRRVLRLLALHPGHDIGYCAIAALTGLPVDSVRTHLGTLVDAHLLQQPSPGRFSLHELLRGYVADLVGLEEPASQVRAAATRLFDYYRRTAATMVSRLGAGAPGSCPPRGGVGPEPAPEAVTEARKWITEEYANLLLITAHAAARGRSGIARDLATTLWQYQRLGPAHRPASEIVQGRSPQRRR